MDTLSMISESWMNLVLSHFLLKKQNWYSIILKEIKNHEDHWSVELVKKVVNEVAVVGEVTILVSLVVVIVIIAGVVIRTLVVQVVVHVVMATLQKHDNLVLDLPAILVVRLDHLEVIEEKVVGGGINNIDARF